MIVIEPEPSRKAADNPEIDAIFLIAIKCKPNTLNTTKPNPKQAKEYTMHKIVAINAKVGFIFVMY